MWTGTKAQLIKWIAWPTALLPVHADQALLTRFGAADEYVNRNNRRRNGLRNPGIGRA